MHTFFNRCLIIYVVLQDCGLFVYCSMLCRQVFEELEEIGKNIQEDVLDAGMSHHGAMGGDISKCPYYTAKMGMRYAF